MVIIIPRSWLVDLFRSGSNRALSQAVWESMVETPEKSQGSHGDGGALLTSDMKRWTLAWRASSGDHKGSCDVKSYVRCMMGEIVKFSFTSVIDIGKHNI
jgi:hypothetical protein